MLQKLNQSGVQTHSRHAANKDYKHDKHYNTLKSGTSKPDVNFHDHQTEKSP
jgi:hypothetical protein